MIILTLAIGPDYRRSMARCLQSKKIYASRHGYTYIEGDDVWRDYSRPFSWSKMGFYINYLEKAMRETPDELIWLSDADVYITNPDLRIEDHIMPLFPTDKDMLFCVDAYDHINAGNIFVRPTQRVIDWFKRVNKRTECTNHIWWENGGMLLEWQDHPEDLTWVEIRDKDHARFNAYLEGLKGNDLWKPGCWLVHFAGIYDGAEINRLIDVINEGAGISLSPTNEAGKPGT
jgi:hypothetical protein